MHKKNIHKIISLLILLVIAISPRIVAAQGAGEACFIAGTKVTLADGSKKPIEELVVGDKVKGQNQVNTVIDIKKPLLATKKLYSINGGKAFVTSAHPFMTTEGWKSFDPEESKKETPGLKVTKLAVGDTLITQDGTITIKSIETASDDPNTLTFNPMLDGDNTYYADNYLVHNKGRNEICSAVCTRNAPSPGTEIQCRPTATSPCPPGQSSAVICGPSNGGVRVCRNTCVTPPLPPSVAPLNDSGRDDSGRDGGGDGDGSDCLAPESLVTMEDGTAKRLDAIKQGDRVKADNGVINTVKGVLTKEWDVLVMYGINNGELRFTIDHPVMTNNGWKAIDYSANPDAQNIYGLSEVGTLKVGDRILTNSGEVEVKSIDPAPPETNYTTYNLTLDGSRSFYANGILVRSN